MKNREIIDRSEPWLALSTAKKLGAKTVAFWQHNVDGKGQCGAWVALWMRRRAKGGNATLFTEKRFEMAADPEVEMVVEDKRRKACRAKRGTPAGGAAPDRPRAALGGRHHDERLWSEREGDRQECHRLSFFA